MWNGTGARGAQRTHGLRQCRIVRSVVATRDRIARSGSWRTGDCVEETADGRRGTGSRTCLCRSRAESLNRPNRGRVSAALPRRHALSTETCQLSTSAFSSAPPQDAEKQGVDMWKKRGSARRKLDRALRYPLRIHKECPGFSGALGIGGDTERRAFKRPPSTAEDYKVADGSPSLPGEGCHRVPEDRRSSRSRT